MTLASKEFYRTHRVIQSTLHVEHVPSGDGACTFTGWTDMQPLSTCSTLAFCAARICAVRSLSAAAVDVGAALAAAASKHMTRAVRIVAMAACTMPVTRPRTLQPMLQCRRRVTMRFCCLWPSGLRPQVPAPRIEQRAQNGTRTLVMRYKVAEGATSGRQELLVHCLLSRSITCASLLVKEWGFRTRLGGSHTCMPVWRLVDHQQMLDAD